MLFGDNGSKFSSQAMDLWAYQNGVRIDFSRSGKPTDNAHVEPFNGSFRQQCLDTHEARGAEGTATPCRHSNDAEHLHSGGHRRQAGSSIEGGKCSLEDVTAV